MVLRTLVWVLRPPSPLCHCLVERCLHREPLARRQGRPHQVAVAAAAAAAAAAVVVVVVVVVVVARRQGRPHHPRDAGEQRRLPARAAGGDQ